MIKKFAAWMVVPIMMLMPAFASAEFVVTFDQFETGAVGGFDADGNGTISFADSALTLERSATPGSFNFSTGEFTTTGTFSLTYDVVGGTFDDLFADLFAVQNPTAPYESGQITKFKFGADPFAAAGAYTLDLNGDTQSSAGNSPVYFSTDGGFSTAVFTFNSAGFYSVGGTNKFSAVPEPASLLLVGSVVGGLGMIRRRRK